MIEKLLRSLFYFAESQPLSARRQTAFWLPRFKFRIDGMSLVQKLKGDQRTFSEGGMVAQWLGRLP